MKMDLKEIFKIMIEKNASDAFIKGNDHIRLRTYTEVSLPIGHGYSNKEMSELVAGMISDREKDALRTKRNCELAIHYEDRWRFRVAIFYEKDNLVMVLRRIDLKPTAFSELNLPSKLLEQLCAERRGLVLITGMAGSGKSTTIAAILEFINANFGKHILTIEEPIEFTFEEKKSIINQRELGRDVVTYDDALRQSVIHSPDVIYISNIRDRDTCYAALSAAETGILVVSTVHSINAVSTVERIINFFPVDERQFILTQLSFLLKGTLSLRLVPRIDAAGLIPAYEAMTLSPTISALIRENELNKIPKCISESDIFDMNSFNQCLWKLVQDRKISSETALTYSDEKKELLLLMDRAKYIN